MFKPIQFQIKIKDRDEWNRAWGMLSKHYTTSTTLTESSYGDGCILKVGNAPDPLLWSSRIGASRVYSTFESWEHFLDHYGQSFKEGVKPTFNDCAELVTIDKDIAIMQIGIRDLEEQLKKQKNHLQKLLTRTEELNKILGIA